MSTSDLPYEVVGVMEGGDRSGVDGAVADRLVERHFAMQHEETTGLSRVEIMALDPALRTLLFTARSLRQCSW